MFGSKKESKVPVVHMPDGEEIPVHLPLFRPKKPKHGVVVTMPDGEEITFQRREE